jgi:hypothetical protein
MEELKMANRYRISTYQKVSLNGRMKWCFWKSVNTEDEYRKIITEKELYGVRVRVIDRESKMTIYETL